MLIGFLLGRPVGFKGLVRLRDFEGTTGGERLFFIRQLSNRRLLGKDGRRLVILRALIVGAG